MPRLVKTTPAADYAPFNPLAKAESSNRPDSENVSRRAYELFLARGGQHGHDLEDWLQAERELSTGRYN